MTLNSNPAQQQFQNQFLDELRRCLQCSDLEVRIDPSWANDRATLQKALEASGANSQQVSISHGPELAGFAYSRQSEGLIGFDVERTERVQEAAARRVAFSEAEYSRAPSAASLWTAKEACFKAMRGPSQPQVLSQIELGNWHTLPSQIETVQLLNSQFSGVGCVVRQNLYTLAVFFVRISKSP